MNRSRKSSWESDGREETCVRIESVVAEGRCGEKVSSIRVFITSGSDLIWLARALVMWLYFCL